MGSVSSSRTPRRRTLWEEGRHPGRLIRTVSAVVLLSVALVEASAGERLGLVVVQPAPLQHGLATGDVDDHQIRAADARLVHRRVEGRLALR